MTEGGAQIDVEVVLVECVRGAYDGHADPRVIGATMDRGSVDSPWRDGQAPAPPTEKWTGRPAARRPAGGTAVPYALIE
jgi:hypothetical protein